MSGDRQTLLEQVLALPVSERAGLAADVLASLPEPESGVEVDSPEWVSEIGRRARRVLAGNSTADDWDVSEQRILARLADE